MLRGRGEGASAVAVFKPIDEEPCAPNNPRGMKASFGSETCRPGIKSGESTLREVIAYLLDHGSFADVPATTLVELTHQSLPYSPISESQVTNKEYLDLISGLLTLEKIDSNQIPEKIQNLEGPSAIQVEFPANSSFESPSTDSSSTRSSSPRPLPQAPKFGSL